MNAGANGGNTCVNTPSKHVIMHLYTGADTLIKPRGHKCPPYKLVVAAMASSYIDLLGVIRVIASHLTPHQAKPTPAPPPLHHAASPQTPA